MHSTTDDWEDEPKKDDEEDLGALGMSVKDADSTGSVDDEDEEEEKGKEEDADEDVTEKKEAPLEEDEPLDGLAALERMEKELEKDEIDVGGDGEDEG
ncbi:MAG: hypothetical protein ABIO72_01280 [Patescibacteria group bacterium]